MAGTTQRSGRRVQGSWPVRGAEGLAGGGRRAGGGPERDARVHQRRPPRVLKTSAVASRPQLLHDEIYPGPAPPAAPRRATFRLTSRGRAGNCSSARETGSVKSEAVAACARVVKFSSSTTWLCSRGRRRGAGSASGDTPFSMRSAATWPEPLLGRWHLSQLRGAAPSRRAPRAPV